MFEIIGIGFGTGGVFFLLISAIGLHRMPDTLTRMHAATKASTLGTLLVIAGAVCLAPGHAFKLGLLGLFVLLTNPLSSSILGRSSYLKDGFYNAAGVDALKKEHP